MPVPNCSQGQAGAGCKTPFNLRYHFAFRHPNDTVTVRGDCPPQVRQLRDKILEECRGAARRRGTPARTYWWKQELTFEGGGQRGGGRLGLGFVMHRGGGGNAWTRGERRRSDAFGDHCSRLRRQQAEELGIVMEEEKEVEDPLPPWHHRTSVGEAALEVEDRMEREKEERWRREAMAEAWQQLQAYLPLELRNFF